MHVKEEEKCNKRAPFSIVQTKKKKNHSANVSWNVNFVLFSLSRLSFKKIFTSDLIDYASWAMGNQSCTTHFNEA